MKIDDPSQYIRKIIEEFEIPAHDSLKECLLSTPGKNPTLWDSAIIVSTNQREKFYPDIFHFWVRAFFFFLEDVRLGSMLCNVINKVECHSISADEFRRSYLALINERVPDEGFTESQAYPETRIELENRSFADSYVVLKSPNIKSCVARSDGEYVAFFVLLDTSKFPS